MCILINVSTYVFSPSYNTCKTVREGYGIKVIQISCPLDILEIIQEQSEKYNMDWKIIYCIIGYESAFNPNTICITQQEKSYGLLQINIKTNFKKDTAPNLLLNPEYNLNYQLKNLKETYINGVKIKLKGVDLAEYISKYGQRADWKNKENAKYIKESIKIYYEEATLIELQY